MSTTPESAGIDIREGNATNPSMIRDNTVTVYSGQWGIRASNSTGTEIRSNDIFLNDFANNLAGIRLESCNNMRVMCNNITGSVTTQLSRQTAIWGEMSTNTLYSCNNTSQCYTGVRFTGFCNGTDLRGTIIGTHRIGFELSFGAFMGIQTHSGNRWTGTYNIIGATADPADVPTSFFIVNNLTPPLAPISYTLGLFSFSTGITFSCTVGGPFSICSEVLGAAQQLNSGDYLIAQDELQPTLFPDPNKWMADSYLYEKLDNNTSLITAGPIWAFYDSVYNTTMHDIYGISKDADAVFDLSAGTKATLAANAVLKTNYTQQYEAIDDQLADTNISATDKADLEAQKNTLSQSLNNLNAANQNLINGIAIAQHLAAQTVKTQNGLLSVGELCAQNQKVVNDIYLYTLAQGTPDLNPDQANQLLAIAQQCPLAGGRAVHQARGLYSNINPTQTYTDASTCAEQGIAYKTQVAANANSTTQPMFGIYPNPANNKATLVLHNPAIGNYRVELYNTIGSLQATYHLTAGDMALNILTNDLATGMYWCKLYNGANQYIGGEKLIVIK